MDDSLTTYDGVIFVVGFALTAIFCALMFLTILRIVGLFIKTISNTETNNASETSSAKKPTRIWMAVVWLVLICPFAAIILMIGDRDPERDKIIKERAFEANTQKDKMPPVKPKYAEPKS